MASVQDIKTECVLSWQSISAKTMRLILCMWMPGFSNPVKYLFVYFSENIMLNSGTLLQKKEYAPQGLICEANMLHTQLCLSFYKTI